MTRNVASTCGAMAAAAAPWTTRAAISSAPDTDESGGQAGQPEQRGTGQEHPLAAELVAEVPAMISAAANASMYPDTTHSSWVALACRSRWMEGSATLTIVTSIMSMSAPTIRTIAASQRRGVSRPGPCRPVWRGRRWRRLPGW